MELSPRPDGLVAAFLWTWLGYSTLTFSSSRSVKDEVIPGGWSERELVLGKHTVRILLPAQPDEFLEQLEQRDNASQEDDPYWAELWPASLPMAKLILAMDWKANTSAIELGCGIGVVGLAGLIAGLDVRFTDRVQLAVDTSIENAHRNGFTYARGQLLDWAEPPQQRYPIVLASDVLYDQKLHSLLVDTIDAILDPDGRCWLGDPGRSAAVSFCELAASRGFGTTTIDESGTVVDRFKTGDFRLLCLKRSV